MITLKNDYELLDEMNLSEMVDYLINTVLIYVLELEDDLYPSSTVKLSIQIEKEIKKNIKLAARELFIADMLIIGDINNRNCIDDENSNIDRFNFLEEKELIDALRYIVVALVKIQSNISKVMDEERIKEILKKAYIYIENINKEMLIMQKQVVEIMKDTRDSDVRRNALNLQNVVDNIKLIIDNTDELNHIDYEYVSALLDKSLLLLCNANYVLTNYIQKPVNPFFQHIHKTP